MNIPVDMINREAMSLRYWCLAGLDTFLNRIFGESNKINSILRDDQSLLICGHMQKPSRCFRQ